MKRGAIRKKESELVALWIPRTLVDAMDTAIQKEDSDRSKFIRRALRRHIFDTGVILQDEPAR